MLLAKVNEGRLLFQPRMKRIAKDWSSENASLFMFITDPAGYGQRFFGRLSADLFYGLG